MEPVLAVIVACIAYVIIFVLVSWLKDIFTWRKQICGVYMESQCAQHTQEVLICIDGIRNVKETIAMIELTTAAYFTLIGLSILAGYTIHGIVDAIRKGDFFDQEDTRWKQ